MKNNIIVNAYCRWDNANEKIIPLNYGDDLNFTFLLELIDDKLYPNHPIENPSYITPKHEDEYCMIGSILSWMTTEKSIVWDDDC